MTNSSVERILSDLLEMRKLAVGVAGIEAMDMLDDVIALVEANLVD